MTDPTSREPGNASPPGTLPGAAAGFPVTLTQAAQHLSTTPEAVVDLVRSGVLGAYVAAAYETTERPPLRFDWQALDNIHQALLQPHEGAEELRTVSEIHAVSASLRSYLTEHAPADTEFTAIKEGRPLLGRGRDTAIYAHVREEPVRARAVKLVSGPALVRLSMPKTVTDVLTRLGCQQVRGVYPVASGKQSWKVWWRVPLSIWSIAAEDALRVDDFPALGGTGLDDEILEDS